MNNDRNINKFNYIDSSEDRFKMGIDLQREYYKQANLDNNYDLMIKILEKHVLMLGLAIF